MISPTSYYYQGAAPVPVPDPRAGLSLIPEPGADISLCIFLLQWCTMTWGGGGRLTASSVSRGSPAVSFMMRCRLEAPSVMLSPSHGVMGPPSSGASSRRFPVGLQQRTAIWIIPVASMALGWRSGVWRAATGALHPPSGEAAGGAPVGGPGAGARSASGGGPPAGGMLSMGSGGAGAGLLGGA